MIIMTEENSVGKGDSIPFTTMYSPNAGPSRLWEGS
jgi:hypothetical protein